MKNFRWNKKVIVAVALAVILLILLVVTAIRKGEQKADGSDEKVYQVAVMAAGETGNDVSLTYTGLVQPAELTQCTFETIGTIEAVYVKKGDRVRAGDLLAAIDDDEAKDQLDAAERQMKYAEKNRDRAQESHDDAQSDYLIACGASKELENLEDAITRRDEQQAKTQKIKAQLEKTPQYKENAAGHFPEINPEYYSLQLQYESAQNTLELYQQNVDSAQKAYDKKVKEGADSDDAKLQKQRYDAAKENLDTAQEAYDGARDRLESAQKTLDKCVLRAKSDGYVVDVSATEGSVSTPIFPAVVLASHDVVVNFGVSQSDVMSLAVDMPAKITVEQQEFAGKIRDVDVVPDESTRTYAVNVTIDVADPDLYLGELATVSLDIGERLGIWLPISVILNDGKDYIYIAEEGRAKRQYITIEEVNDDYVLVTGTKAGTLIITEGMKLIRTGSAVSYEE